MTCRPAPTPAEIAWLIDTFTKLPRQQREALLVAALALSETIPDREPHRDTSHH
jgi:hypothetical protein